MLKHTLGHSSLFLGSLTLMAAAPESGHGAGWPVLSALNISSKTSVWIHRRGGKVS